MWSYEVFENLDGKGLKKTGGYEAPDETSTRKNWEAMIAGERKPGSYAVLTDDNGNEVARKDW